MVKSALKHPLNFCDRSLAPLEVQNSLVELKLEILGCFSILDDDTLSKHVPNLQSLTCVDMYHGKHPEILQHIPSGLKRLELDAKDVPYQEELSIATFSHILPPNIETVIIKFLKLLSPSWDDPDSDIIWPQSLKHLSVYRLPILFILADIPASLEVLEGFSMISADVELEMSTVPKTMKIMSINLVGAGSVTVDLDAPMPSELVIWNLGQLKSPTHESLSLLSPKLEKLGCLDQLRAAFPSLDVATYMPNCKELDLKLEETTQVNRLPDRLVSLHLLPRGINQIPIPPVIVEELLSIVPPTLQSLSMIPSRPEQICHLPPSLTHLKLLPDRPKLVVAPAPTFGQWQQLPPSLTSLVLDLQLLSSVEHISALPRTLTDLQLHMSEICVPDTSEKDQEEGKEEEARTVFSYEGKLARTREIRRREYQLARFDPRLPQFLPLSLERLGFHCGSIHCNYGLWVVNLKHLTLLKTLVVTCAAITSAAFHSSSESFLGDCLPPSLTELEIPTNVFTTLNHLPAALTSLKVFFPLNDDILVDPEEHLITNEHLARLPPNLTCFSMHGLSRSCSSSLSPQLFETLPQYLIQYPFGPSEILSPAWLEAWRRYCDPVKWLGFPPKQPQEDPS
jgi:hypothetical protein